MHRSARAVVIGGGVGGCSILYWLTKLGWDDVLLVESTYGDRIHEPDDRGARLEAIVNDSVKRGGKLIVPAFAIGRVEEVL